MRKNTSGFTIIEILVVIAVIGILTTISVISFSRYQGDARDSQRASRATIIAEALEKYYDKNGEYPSCSAVTAAAPTVTTATLPGVDPTVLVTPRVSGGETNSIECTTLTATGTDFFEYSGDGSAACSGSSSCLGFTLKYQDEATGTIKTISSRRSTSIATTDAATMSISSTGFDNVGLSWTTVANATSYTVQRATNAGFTSGFFETTSATTTFNSSGLSVATTYYFRVKAVSSNGSEGSFSNIVNTTTLQLNAPVPSASSTSNTQITVTWAAVTNATTYNLDYSTSSTFASGVTSITSIGSTSQLVSSLTTGTTYYFRVKAVNGIFQSGWSSTVSAVPAVPPVTSLTATTNSTTQITANWSSVAVATSYTLDYSTSSTFASGVTSISGISGISRAVTALVPGTTYYFRVFAYVGATPSVASPTANATTQISAPPSVTVTASLQGTRLFSAGSWAAWDSSDSQSGTWNYVQGTASNTCAAGTTAMYRFSGAYNSFSGSYSWTQWASYQAHPSNTGYMVGLWSGYGARFTATVYCAGANINSSTSSGTGCIWYGGATSPCNW